MYTKTHLSSDSRTKVVHPINRQGVTNPMYTSEPLTNQSQTKQEHLSNTISSLMFWGLGILAMTLFYKALSSLLL